MLANKIIRYLTLGIGLAYATIPIYMNYESLSLLTGQIVFFLLSITPFFVYFFFSRKENNKLNLLLPSVPICILYSLLLSSYFESTSSTSALVFIIAPVMGFGLLIVAYLILYLISKFKPKTV
jgi:hypothetical protein